MSRPSDWSPLAGYDPVPGDPDQVRASARQYRDTAEAIRTAAARLREITDGTADARGQYIEAFRTQADGVADKVEKAYDRYDKTAEALEGYAPELERAQDTADRALQRAKDAEAEAQQWEASSPSWDGPIPGSPGAMGRDIDQDAWDDYRAERDRVQGRVDAARGEIEAQRRVMEQAVADRDDAADRARRSIEDIIEHDGLEDSWWENVKQGLAAVADIAGTIATWAGVLSLAVAWIPGIGQALAAVLGTVALIAGVVSLAANIVLAFSGDASWGDVAWGAVGVLSFGVGRAAGAAVKLGSRLGRLTAVGSRTAAGSTMRGIASGLRGSRVAGNARVTSVARWLSGRGTAIRGNGIGTAWDDTVGATRTFAHKGYTTAFRGQHGLRHSVDEVFQGLRNPSRMVHIQDGDLLQIARTQGWGDAATKAYLANYQGNLYEGAASWVANVNFAQSQFSTVDSVQSQFAPAPGAIGH